MTSKIRRNFWRFVLIAILVMSTASILYDRWLGREVPTQISANSTYALLLVNLLVVMTLVLRPSALGLATRTNKN